MSHDDFVPPAGNAIDSDEEEDLEEDKESLEDLSMIWDCKKTKRTGEKGHEDEGWLCGWCNIELKKWNETKALNHLMRVARSHITGCKGGGNGCQSYEAICYVIVKEGKQQE
jgi:hypothetical protein